MDKPLRELLKKAQRQEDQNAVARVNRIVSAVRKYGKQFHKVELVNIENEVEHAVGRLKMDGAID